MFGFIKQLKERRGVRKRSEETLKDIKEAKRVYLREERCCMCSCFRRVDLDRYYNCFEIQKRIPEFKPETFNVDPVSLWNFWWSVSDRESRIKAFDKLIEIYSK